MAHDKPIDRDNPSCILFVIDQSASMSDPFPGEVGRSKAKALADAVNRLLYETLLRCEKGEEMPRHYFDVGVIGYGATIGFAWEDQSRLHGQQLVATKDLRNGIIRTEPRKKREPDGAGGTITLDFNLPIWVEPKADNGTPMQAALDLALSVLEPWVAQHPASFPPTVFHVTDGQPNPGDQPKLPAERLRNLTTQDGNVLVFDLHLSEVPGPMLFCPGQATPMPDSFAQMLFDMSSPMPEKFRLEALKEDPPLQLAEDARGFVYQSDAVEFIRFFDIGTRLQQSNLR